MAEEFRFFLRTALYAAVLAVIYWFASYESAGTVLLAVLALALGFFIVLGRLFAGAREPAMGSGGGMLGAIGRWIGFTEPRDVAGPLEAGSELVPLRSAAPIVTAAGAIVIGLGAIYGLWLVVPGLVVLAIGLYGWITQFDR